MKKNFIEKLNGGKVSIGTLITLNSPEVAEIFSSCGFDWLFIDMEHGTISISSAQHIIQSMLNECSAVVRIPENSSVWIKKALDIGSDGIIIPLVNTEEDARCAVNSAKYPPLGSRSVGIARAQGYGMNFIEYIKSANNSVALIIQIEHIKAVENLDAILSVDGIDGVLIGPYDLSGSMNKLGEITDDDVQATIKKIKEACQKHSVPYGIFVMNADEARKKVDEGYNFIAVGIDTIFLGSSAKESLEKIKE